MLEAEKREARVPRATYRLQFHAGFTFKDALALVPYLASLGVSHVYSSPLLRARAGSSHGYDIVDHAALNPELGSAADFDALVAALQAAGLGLILDVVPNHMAVLAADNPWWQDVLQHGRDARHAGYFDIDWQPANPDLRDRVMLPLLGEHYGACLHAGQLRLALDVPRGAVELHYYEHCLPLSPASHGALCAAAAERCAPIAPSRVALTGLAAQFDAVLPGAAEALTLGQGAFAAVLAREPQVHAALDAVLVAWNGVPGEPASFDALHALLERQAYRLCHWRAAADDINYRRFFDVNHLAALRMENDEVFARTHALVLMLVRRGAVDGLRIDHPDGLYDPAQYFRRLQVGAASDASLSATARPLYLVAEKIIAPFEKVSTDWPLHGTTGYRFSNLVNALCVDTRAADAMTRVYTRFTGENASFADIVLHSKRTVLRDSFMSELGMLVHQLANIARQARDTRDFTENALRRALGEVAVCFPIYRTYIAAEVGADDRRYIDWAVAKARRRGQAADTSVFDFVRASLFGETPHAELLTATRHFARKFQQFTGPLMAKGFEDTALYRYNRLLSLNDVGGDPTAFGVGVQAFHGASLDRQRSWPHTLIATATHDNKRAPDVRARLNVLSEMPARWRLALRRWRRANRRHVKSLDDRPAPSANDQYLVYQTLVGSCPVAFGDDAARRDYRRRIEDYVLKAAREAKQDTSWLKPNEDYEQALREFVGALLGDGRPTRFLADLAPLVRTLAWFGMLNGLTSTLLLLTSPGVPDLYQGTELWDFSLVDPDNRRAVDFARRAALLEEVRAAAAGDAFNDALATWAENLADARLKLHFVHRLLELRRRLPTLFRDGGYQPLTVTGTAAQHVVAFQRECAGERVVVVAGRLFAALGGEAGHMPVGARLWGDTAVALPDEGASVFVDELRGRELRVHDGRLALVDLFETFPGCALRGA